jgi:two-component system sensor histidine kinase UhpB
MNLQLHLLSRILFVALTCLVLIAAFLLYHSHQIAEQTTQKMAGSLAKQLESQLLLSNAGLGRTNPFPDFQTWKQSYNQAGVCLSYASADSRTSQSLCNGSNPSLTEWPSFFETSYRQIFNPGLPVVRSIAVNGRVYGSVTVTPSAELEIAEAWNKTLSLMALSSATVFTVCLLVYWTISRALRPAQTIVASIAEMESGQLDCRLPIFELNEWQRIAAAINHFASGQQQLLRDRQKLLVKLINLQEAERRTLARELHDEFGQCLAAINAVTASIRETAKQQYPELITETKHINRITTHMMNGVRDMLGRLRPAEFDDLGLATSLNRLVVSWNARSKGKARYHLTINGDCSSLSDTQAVTLFRITQECLTNIIKHASATHVDINLNVSAESIILTIKDNGIANALPFADASGIGLLGIRERITALQGQLQMAIADPQGLIVEICLPTIISTENSHDHHLVG